MVGVFGQRVLRHVMVVYSSVIEIVKILIRLIPPRVQDQIRRIATAMKPPVLVSSIEYHQMYITDNTSVCMNPNSMYKETKNREF